MQQPLLAFYADMRQVTVPENAVTLGPRVTTETNAGDGAADLQPLLFTYPPLVQVDVFSHITAQVASILKKYFPEMSVALDHIMSSMPTDQTGKEKLTAKLFLPGTDLTDCFPSNVPVEILSLLFSHVVKPFIRRYVAMALPLRDLNSWYRGDCPVCGAKPALAVLEKDSKGKSLYCGFCEVKWRYYRLSCPFCSSRESQYIFIEGEEKYRIYLCEQCHSYIKTINAEKNLDEELDLFMEEINTIHLDLMAIRENYHR